MALGVALCPMYVEAGYVPYSKCLHFTFAVLLLLCMAYAAIFCHDTTLIWVADDRRRARYRLTYYIVGWFMGLFPFVGLILAHFFNAVDRNVFWIEAAGIWAFAAYWYVKSRELEESEVEKKAATGALSQPYAV